MIVYVSYKKKFEIVTHDDENVYTSANICTLHITHLDIKNSHMSHLINVPKASYPPVFSSSVVAIHLWVVLSNLAMERLLLLTVGDTVEDGAKAATEHDTERSTKMIELIVDGMVD